MSIRFTWVESIDQHGGGVRAMWASAQVRRNARIEILPLSTGCLGACTYCKTKHARGQLGSYELTALAKRAAAAAADPLVRGLPPFYICHNDEIPVLM